MKNDDQVTLTEMLEDDLGIAAEIADVLKQFPGEQSLIQKGSAQSGYYGPRPGTGRPGEIGGSKPQAEATVGPIQGGFETAVAHGETLAGQVDAAYGGILPVLRKDLLAQGFSDADVEQYMTMLDDWTHGSKEGLVTLRAMAHQIYGGDVHLPWSVGAPASEAKIAELVAHPKSSKPGEISTQKLATAMGVHAGIVRAIIRTQNNYDKATDSVLLYRGIKVEDFPHKAGDEFQVTHGSISSYTSSERLANTFGYGVKQYGVTFESRIPLKYIFADHGDVGNPGEFENLVFYGHSMKGKVLRVMEPAPQFRKKKGAVIDIDADPENREWLKVLRKQKKKP